MPEKKNDSKLLVTLSAAVVAASAIPQAAHAGISVSCGQDLVFGTVIGCTGTGTVRVTAGGTRTLTGCLTSGGAGTVSPGRCFISDTSFPPQPIVISITAAGSISNGTSNMTAGTYDLSTTSSTGAGNTITITATSTDVFFGATLNVGASQPDGVYTGTNATTLNANYQ